jgi:dsRNA-specific ribonuclease
LEQLIGYTFTRKSLLVEAMSHASCITGSGSLERFEFLGDSILDYLVVRNFQSQTSKKLSHIQMHLLRTALVNADYLAFLCMEWAVEQERTDIVEVERMTDADTGLLKQDTMVSLSLWRFMRHHAPQVGIVQVTTAKRHAELRYEINAAIASGHSYPWALLAKLQAQKFYSDVVESLLGAVWIDSGSFEVCEGVIERMGMLPYLRRILSDGVEVLHPKEQLGMLADSETVEYRLGVNMGVGVKIGEREYTCKVLVGKEEIVEVDGGVGKEEVRIKAAEAAVRILKGRNVIEEDEVVLNGLQGDEIRDTDDSDEMDHES